MSAGIILSGLGILIALSGMAVLIFKKISPIIIGPIAAIVVVIFSRLDIYDAIVNTYVGGVGSFFISYFLIFLLGNLFGSIYQISGAASKIGSAIAHCVGSKNCMLACLLSSALLSYGGINSFVIIFAIYPIALKLFEEADIPTYLLPGIVCGGMWTFAMTGPFSPQICNIVSMENLGTSSYAGLIPGIAASVAMAVLIVIYMNHAVKKAKAAGHHFEKYDDGIINSAVHQNQPNTLLSLIPLVTVVVIFNITDIGIIACLCIGIAMSLVLFCKTIPWHSLISVINNSASESVSVIINTAAIVGFGAVAKLTPFYSYAVEVLEASAANPYVVAAVGSNVFAGILGSSSGGITLMYTSLKDTFLNYGAQGYNLGFIHRLCTFGSGGLDSMPWNGSIISVFNICKTDHAHSYKYNFVTCCVIPVICTFLIALPICILLG